MPFLSISAAFTAVIAIGTVCRFSERRCAVTVISSSPGLCAGLVSAANSGVAPQISQANGQARVNTRMKPDARVGAESKELNIVIPHSIFSSVGVLAPCSLRRGELSLPAEGMQVQEAHCEITGVVAVCTIHNSVDE